MAVQATEQAPAVGARISVLFGGRWWGATVDLVYPGPFGGFFEYSFDDVPGEPGGRCLPRRRVPPGGVPVTTTEGTKMGKATVTRGQIWISKDPLSMLVEVLCFWGGYVTYAEPGFDGLAMSAHESVFLSWYRPVDPGCGIVVACDEYAGLERCGDPAGALCSACLARKAVK